MTEANLIKLTLRYLDMSNIPAQEVDTFIVVKNQWQSILVNASNGASPPKVPVEKIATQKIDKEEKEVSIDEGYIGE
jgi:hypothetical protein